MILNLNLSSFFILLKISIALTQSKILLNVTADTVKLIAVPAPIRSVGKTYYVEPYFMANWYRAHQFCRYHGMNLASVKSAREQEDLNKGLKSISDVAKDYWSSGNDLAQTKHFVWESDGTAFSYQNWHPDQPSLVSWDHEPEHCVLLSNWGDPTLKWNDARCWTDRYFICQKDDI